MFSKTTNRAPMILLVLALCAFPGAAQAGGFDPAGLEGFSFFARLQERVEDLASRLWEGVARAWEKEGGSIDPSGKPTPGEGSGAGTTNTTGSGGESGGSIDPDG